MIKACLNGARSLDAHARLSNVPATIAREARLAVDAGAEALHVHPKDAAGRDSLDPLDVERYVLAVRESCPGVPVGITTGAWAVPEPSARVYAISCWNIKPDFASLNWHEEGADAIAETLLNLGVGIEAGLWHKQGVQAWQASPWRHRCLRALIELGDLPDGEDAEWVREQASGLIEAVAATAPGMPLLLHGEEGSTWPALDFALELGLDTRVGLEDTLRLPDGTLAPGNAELVKEALRRLVAAAK